MSNFAVFSRAKDVLYPASPPAAPTELGSISKNLPLGPRARFLLIDPSSVGRLRILVVIHWNAKTCPLLINFVFSQGHFPT